MTAMQAWLETLGLGHYAEAFADNDVDLETLPHLTDDDLKELGLSLGHRRKLMAALDERPREPGPPESPAAEAERRQLTVLFCDLAGSTELSERLDPEEMRTVLGRYHDAVAQAIAAQGGHVAKLLGDGVLAFFGWPQANEDDAERAVRAGLAALAATSGIHADGAPLSARAGIATGPVVVGDRASDAAREQGAVSGATPNLAARLQSVAAPGEVIIHGATRRLVGGAFELEDRGEQPLKGFSAPVATWRVLGASQAGTRFDAQHGAGLTGFVGRDQEIGLLADRWRRAVAGDGQVVLLSGEAGIGKSRILREFVAASGQAEVRQVRWQCSPHEVNTAFHPLAAELGATAGFAPSDAPEARYEKLRHHLATVFDDIELAFPLLAAVCGLPADLFPPVDLGPQRQKQMTVRLLSDRIVRLAARQPVALLVEDIHWVDPSTLEVLDDIVRRSRHAPILAVMTHRPEFRHQWDAFGHLTAQSLNRLDRSEGREIAERVAGGKALPDAFLQRILEQTDGVPLFVEELTKTVLESEILEERADRYVLTGALPALSIPTTLQDSLMARLDRLAPVKRVIQAAACIGREFTAGLLAPVVSMSMTDLEAALRQLVEAGLVFPNGAGEDGRYIFKHALVQDAAYASLLHSTRRSMHERLAGALEQAEDPDDLELARHFSGAGANERAARLYLAGGRRQLERSNLPEAIGALALGLEAIEAATENGRTELDLRVALGAARMANFGWAHPSVSEALEPAFRLAESIGDTEALGSILWGLWVHYQTRADFPSAHRWLAELETLADQHGATDLPVVYDMSAGCQYFWEADYTRALGHTDRVKSVYDRARHSRIAALTNHDPLVFSLHWAGAFADWIAGRPERSLERLDEAVALAREIGHPFNLVFALTPGSSSLIYLGQADRLLAQCDEAAAVIAEEALGPFSEHVNVMQWRGAALIQRGELERGYSLAREGNDFWAESGGRICTAMMRSWQVVALLGLGRIDEATQLNLANIAHCRETGDCYMEPECLRLQGELALAAGMPDRAGAERWFREAGEVARRHGAGSWELRGAISLAAFLRDEGRSAEGSAALEPVLARFREGWATPDLIAARELADAIG